MAALKRNKRCWYMLIFRYIFILLLLTTSMCLYYLSIPETIIFEEVIPSSSSVIEHIPIIRLNNIPIPNVTINLWKDCKGFITINVIIMKLMFILIILYNRTIKRS